VDAKAPGSGIRAPVLILVCGRLKSSRRTAFQALRTANRFLERIRGVLSASIHAGTPLPNCDSKTWCTCKLSPFQKPDLSPKMSDMRNFRVLSRIEIRRALSG